MMCANRTVCWCPGPGAQPALLGVSEGWKVSRRGQVKRRRVEGKEGRRQHTPQRVWEHGSGEQEAAALRAG